MGYVVDPTTGSSCHESTTNCSLGQASNGGFCVRLCSPGQYFYSGFCLVACPTGFVINGVAAGCIPQQSTIACPAGQVSYLGSCLNSCPAGTYPSSGACLNCSFNCNNCLNSTYCVNCVLGYYFSAGGCQLSASCAPPQLSLGATCISSCPYGTYSTGVVCEKGCDGSLLSYSGWCYQNCPSGLVSNGYGCIAECPLGQISVNGTCTANSNSGCPSGFFLSGSCLPCQSPCATCVGLATICTSCTSGVLVNSQCQGGSDGLSAATALTVAVASATQTGNQLEVVLSLSVPISTLSIDQLSQFFVVTVLPFDANNQAQVFQWATNSGSTVHVLLQFSAVPSPDTLVFFSLNVAALASSYAALGVTDLSRANAQIAIANAQPGTSTVVPSGLVATLAQNERAQTRVLV